MGTLTVTDVTMTVTVMEIARGTVTGTATVTGIVSASVTATGTVAVKTMDGRGTMRMMRTKTLVPREDTKSHCPRMFPHTWWVSVLLLFQLSHCFHHW